MERQTKKSWRSILLALLVTTCFLFILPFWQPLVLAVIVAVLIDPVAKKMVRRGIVRSTVVWCLIAAITIVSAGIITIAVSESAELLQNSLSSAGTADGIQNKSGQSIPIVKRVDSISEKLLGAERAGELKSYIISGTKAGAQWLVRVLTGFISSLPHIALFAFIFVFALYYFVVDGRKIISTFYKNELFSTKETDTMLETFIHAIRSVVASSSIVGVLQATVLSIGSLLFGVGNVFLVFILTFLFSFIPLIGSGPVGVFLIGIALFTGNTAATIGLTVFLIIAGTVDNVVRPQLVKGDLHPLVSLISIVGGVYVFGVLGLFIGPILVEFTNKTLTEIAHSNPFKTTSRYVEAKPLKTTTDTVFPANPVPKF